MPYGYTPPSWGTSTTGGNRPPSERVWEEDRTRPVDTSQPVDRGDPIVPIDETIQQDLPVIENLGSSNLEKLLSDEERKWNFLNALQNEWVGSGSDPRYSYDENYPALGVSSPYAMQGMEWNPDASEWGTTQGGGISPAWQGATQYDDRGNIIGGTKMGDPGAVLLNAKAVELGHQPVWGKPILSGLGEELYNYDWTDGGANPYGTIPNPWDDWWGSGGGQQYGMPGFSSLADLARRTWFSESLADVEAREAERLEEGLGVATMANMEQMYGREFAAQASPLHDPEFSLKATEEYDPLYGDLRLWQEAQTA